MMSPRDTQYKKIWVGTAFLTMACLLSVFFALRFHRDDSPMQASFVLTDQDGHVYNSIKSKSYKLIFFGFTNCPDICPTGLGTMQKILNALGPAAKNIQPIFVTVDPERDQPHVLKKYLSHFGPSFIGLTGPDIFLQNMRDRYAVYARPRTDGSESRIAHSGHIYVTDQEDHIVDIFDYRVDPDQAAKLIRSLMGRTDSSQQEKIYE